MLDLSALAMKYIPTLNQKQNLVALVFEKGRIIAVGKNSYTKTHPLQERLAKKVGVGARLYLHAEVAALIKARGRGDTMVVLRRNKHGLGIAKPCSICQEALRLSNLKVIHS